MNPKVSVVLSSYNGEKYIIDQVDSVLDQHGVDVQLYIRDDGSSDRTVSLVTEKYRTEPVTVVRGSNLGFIDSFVEALKGAPSADYYAFCDQDDVWFPNKLNKAISILGEIGAEMPSVYGSDSLLCTETLEPLGRMMTQQQFDAVRSADPRVPLSEGKTMYGHTQVFNRKAREGLLRMAEQGLSWGHDAALYHYCNFYGRAVFDTGYYTYYRRHQTAASTSGFGIARQMGETFARICRHECARSHLAYCLLATFGSDSLSPQNEAFLSETAHYKDSIRKTVEYMSSNNISSGGLRGVKLRMLVALRQF